jgi:hypothetical protein
LITCPVLPSLSTSCCKITSMAYILVYGTNDMKRACLIASAMRL